MEARGAGGSIEEWADTGIPCWWAHRKHGSNLWYENGSCCLFPSKGHGECRKRMLAFYATVWFVTSLTAPGPPCLCCSSSLGGQQAAGRDKIRSGAPSPDFWLHRPAVRMAAGCKSPVGGALSHRAIGPALLVPLRTSPPCFAPCHVVFSSLLT